MNQPKEVKIVSEVNCKNSPKSELLRDITISAVQQQLAHTLEWLTEDITWTIVGEGVIQGIEAVEERMWPYIDQSILELHIDHIITHGKTAALNGNLIYENQKDFEFCHVYTFNSHSKKAKIKEIKTYLIKK